MPDEAPVTNMVFPSRENGLKLFASIYLEILFKIKLFGRHTDIGTTFLRLCHQHTAGTKRNIVSDLNLLQYDAVNTEKVAIPNSHGTR